MKTNIVLTGFMGSGKSTVGRLVAEALQRDFVDSDDLIVERAGKSIAQMFAEEGEEGFRGLESSVCQHLATQDDLVIATGGGALLDEVNRSALERGGILICLLASPAEIHRRLSGESGRPLFNGNWEALYQERLPAYQGIAHRINTDGKTPLEVAQKVVKLWRASR
ncbi:MAG: shikimate kinase [Anaerolineaceae bacterium]|nr:shikimate kinase [Anaerolineaceae bacterium]MDE0329920.1 shikimate kinase [Anaerolineaceae bacterium]